MGAFGAFGAGWQKLHVIADNYQLLILTEPKAPAGPGQCAEGARQGSALKAPARAVR